MQSETKTDGAALGVWRVSAAPTHVLGPAIASPGGTVQLPVPPWRAGEPPAAGRIVQDAWWPAIRARLIAHVWLKALVIPVFVSGFFMLYFALLQNPIRPVTEMPLNALDHGIGFEPWALAPYASLWIYVFAAPALLSGWREINRYAASAVTLTLVGFGTFLLWPTRVPRPEIDWTLYPAVEFLKSVDAAGNAFPSLHVAFAVLTFIWLERQLRELAVPSLFRIGSALWCAAIVVSTLSTKQHVAADALAGGTLGIMGAMFYPRAVSSSLSRASHPLLSRQGLAFGLSLGTKATLLLLGRDLVHPSVAAVLFFGPDLLILRGLLIPNAVGLMPTVTSFATEHREVWLTIDDGPRPETTPAMLDLLDQYGARATFFVIGEAATAAPGLIGEIVRRGHSVGNHTFSHPLVSFWCAGPRRTAREVDRADAALQAAGAEPTAWFRAPAGIKTLFLRRALQRRQKVLVGWTGRGREHFSASPAVPLRRLRKSIRPGAILLVHESTRQAGRQIALLHALLAHLHAEGYACVLPARRDVV